MTPVAELADYRALLAYAARIGRDANLAQAAGGNVSFKHDGVLWVKASGTWLMHAEEHDIMVPVAIAELKQAMRQGDAENVVPFVVARLNRSGLRPSIETTMHAALRHRVVVHVHCVETIAWATRQDAEAALAPLLAGLSWRFIPYVRPGAPLTQAILRRCQEDTDVLVLGNHGLVAGGDDTKAAARLIDDVARRLRRPPRPPGPVDRDRLNKCSAGTRYAPATDDAIHSVATDAKSLAVARLGSLYPDHVIFLGPGIAEWTGAEERCVCVLPGAGVLVRDDAGAAAVALARCLADVTARLDPDEPLRMLTRAEEAELLGWDAEIYRRQLRIE
ncbi:MAG: class II aldolase/adducin family protein [Acetobacteraceae bacterium]